MDRFLALILVSSFAFLMVEGKAGWKLHHQGCSEAEMCCEGRNNTCRALGPRVRNVDMDEGDASANTVVKGFCFCDSTCSQLGDCCTDYAEYCRAVDCVLGEEWGAWGLCDNPCGRGVKERTRPVLRAQENGGAACGPYTEKVTCVGDYNCKIARSPTMEMRETAKVIPAMYGAWRRNKMYNPFKDIRKNLFRHYSANAIIERPSYYALFEVSEARRSCQFGGSSNPWAPQLQSGAVICVECQETAMMKSLGVRCKGHGVFKRETRWNAITAHGCHGWWTMKTEHMEGSCDPENELSFILV